jgi:hypothetical protein
MTSFVIAGRDEVAKPESMPSGLWLSIPGPVLTRHPGMTM